MNRKDAAKDRAFAAWAASGKDAGFFTKLAEAVRGELKDSALPWRTVEHASHLELGRIKGIEEVLFILNDPLGEQKKEIPSIPAPNYGNTVKSNA